MAHRRMELAAAAFLGILANGAPACASDVANGERLAVRWCAPCHVVSPGQTRAQADAPSFAAISATRRIPEIDGFLRQSHPQMPDMSLTRNEISDLIAYMQTLAAPLDPAAPPARKDDYAPPTRG